MAVKITEDMHKAFIDNGFTEDDITNTVNHYRSQGQSDDEIFNNLNTKYQSLQGKTQKVEGGTITDNGKGKLPSIKVDMPQENQGTTKTLQGQVKMYNKSPNPVRNAIRQAGRNTARFLLPKKFENWFLGSKEDEEFLKTHNDENVMSYDDARALYKQGILSKEEYIEKIQERGRLEQLRPEAEYREVRNKNIGKGIIDIGTAFIPFGGGGKIVAKGAGLLKPYLGRKIAEEVVSGTVAGAKAGMTHGMATGLIDEDINPLKEGLAEGASWGIGGGALGYGGGQVAKWFRGKKLRKSKPVREMTKQERKQFRTQARNYYNDYINGTSVKRNDLGKINFGNAGIDELVSKGLHNAKYLQDLKKQIKTGKKQPQPRNDYEREDIKQFHIIDNKLDGKNLEYQIAEDIHGNKYYFTKDVTNKKGLNPTNRNQYPASEINPNNIINDTAENFNPSKQFFGADVPENVNITERIPEVQSREKFNNTMGIEPNFDAEQALSNIDMKNQVFDKQKYEEAYDLLSAVTGKDKTWLKMYLSPNQNSGQVTGQQSLFGGLMQKIRGKGTSKRQSFASELVNKLKGDEIEVNGFNNGDFPNYITQTAEDIYNNGIDQEAILSRVMQDIGENNFYKPINPADNGLDAALNSAEVKYKDLFKRLSESNGDDIAYQKAITEFDDIVKDVPQELQQDFANRFNNDLENVYKTHQTENLRAKGDIKQSRLAKTADLPAEIKDPLNNLPPEYQVLHNNDLMAQVQKNIEKDANGVRTGIERKIANDETLTAEDFESARQLLTKLYQENRLDEAVLLTEKMTQAASKAGQSVQSLSLWTKTTPEGAVKYAQQILKKFENDTGKKIKLTPEQAEDIKGLAQNLQQAAEGREQEVALGKMNKYITDLMPTSWNDKLDTYRYVNMLLSPKSRNKDFILTGLNSADNAVDELIANGIDKVRSLFPNQKRVYRGLHPKEWFGGLKKGLKEGIEDVKLGINTSRSGEKGRYGISKRERFKYKPLNEVQGINKVTQAIENFMHGAEKGLNYSISVPDRMFYEARYASSLKSQMEAAGVEKPTLSMLEQAAKEAREAVYQDDSWVNGIGQNIRGGMNNLTEYLEKATGLRNIPRAGDYVIPFVTTPANIANIGLKNTAGGIPATVKLINAIRKGDQQGIRDAEMLMAKNIKGLAPLGIGMGIGAGAINSNIGSTNYQQDEINGIKPQSIVIGDKAISLKDYPQWSIPMAFGKGLKEGGISQGILNASNAVADMSALKSLGDVVSTVKGGYGQELDANKILDNVIRNQGVNAISQFIPMGGTLGELRNDIDPSSRELYTENTGDYVKNRLINRLPFASKTLPQKYDATGEEVLINNIKNPAARVLSESFDFGIRNYKNNDTYNKLQDFAKEMKDTDARGRTNIELKKSKRTIKVNGENIKLTNKEYSKFQHEYGKINHYLRQRALNNSEFTKLSNEEKTTYLSELRQSIEEAVKIKQLGHQPSRKLKPYTQQILDNYDKYIRRDK